MKLSIIVPVYNVQDYLKTCITSLFNQNIDTYEYEVIAVNDGSTDNSLAILESLKKIFDIKIITQENQGLSGARNTGIDAALGEYLLFIDSDDYILKNTLKEALNISQKKDLDILEFGINGVTKSDELVFTNKITTNGKVLSGEKYIASINFINSACNKFYKREFLNKHHLRFMENVFIEDIEFNSRTIFKAEKIQAIDTIIGHWLQREGSITRTNDFGKIKKMIYDIHTVLTSINNFNETQITSKSIAI